MRPVRPAPVLAIVILTAVALLTSACASSSSTTTSAAGLPAVANPTNLKVEPVVSPGTSPPPNTLLFKNLVVGTGKVATSSSTVLVKYVGAAYTSGKDFTASTWTQGQATSFSLHGVVPGFAQGITGMKVGGRREIVIPPSLGYGSGGSGATIKPNETLVFVVDLEAVS
ncbi:MAG: FKBP-type peptidyl-prolyl cis-trans isomerase [Acidimicrobiales bacterium]